MANTLGSYNPIFYAQEALIALESALGMAGAVHRGYDEERRSFSKGDVINIKRPSTFTAQSAPSTAQDVNTGTVDIKLDKWKEVKFSLTDQELAYTTDKIISDHIRPAAYALALDIDTALNGLYSDVPWSHTVGATAGVSDITNTRKLLFNNQVPVKDSMNMFMEIDGNVEADFLELSAFSQNQGAGDDGIATQVSGLLGRKYGFGVFANQNVSQHIAGTLGGTPVAGAAAAGSTVLPITAAAAAGTLSKGDIIIVAGIEQQFVVTASVTASGGAVNPVVYPALPSALSGGEAIAVVQTSGSENLAFHRNAFALALAPLPEIGNGIGANIATVSDPITGLSLRSRIYYDGDQSKVNVALDVLYGIKTLDGNLACRMVQA